MATTPATLRAAQLDQIPPLDAQVGHHYELTEGELLIVGSASARHVLLKTEIMTLLLEQVPRRIGRVLSESQFNLAEDTARQADVAFVSAARWPELVAQAEAVGSGFNAYPNLAIEIISPSESGTYMERRLHDYLNAGTTEVWHVYPEVETVQVWTREGAKEYQGETAIRSVVLPELHLTPAVIFSGLR